MSQSALGGGALQGCTCVCACCGCCFSLRPRHPFPEPSNPTVGSSPRCDLQSSRIPGGKKGTEGSALPHRFPPWSDKPAAARMQGDRGGGRWGGGKATERLLSTPYLPSHTQNGPWWRARSAGKLLQRDANHQPHETADPAEHGRRVTVRILINLTLTYMATRSQWLPYWMAHFWTLY